MPVLRLTKIFNFEMAHALYGYDGPCKNIHGHSYSLHVTVVGEPLNDANAPKNGMVIDFSILKKIVKESIVDGMDHALVLNEHSPHKDFKKNNDLFDKVVLLPYQPTCENMLIDFAERIKSKLPGHIQLDHLKLVETPTSYVTWHASDNK